MKILVTGGTGLIGKQLCFKLLEDKHELVILTRDVGKARHEMGEQFKFIYWDAFSGMPPREAYEGINAIYNLMGTNIGEKRWSKKQKAMIRKSRVEGAQNLFKGAEKYLDSELSLAVNASAIGIYPVNHGDQVIVEGDSTSNEASIEGSGSSFLSAVCLEWESTLENFSLPKRKVWLRTGVVLSDKDGALAKLLPLFDLGGGGPVASGGQWMSWIHESDIVEIYAWLAREGEGAKVDGVVNATAPFPVTNLEFSRALARALKRPAFLPAPAFAIKLVLGEMATLVLDGQKVVSNKLKAPIFSFRYSKIEDAFVDLVKKWRT